MRYLCLGFHDEQAFAALSESDLKSLLTENSAYEDELRKNGHYIDGNALLGASSAATLRFEKGKVSVTDGPFAETKEQLGGVMVLEAKDLNHAIQLMSQVPCVRLGGSLEIRPINDNVCSSLGEKNHEIPATDLHERERHERVRARAVL
jgi:hypothetical protein